MKPEYEPRTREQFYGHVVEECGEVLAAVGKTLRWGELSYNPELPREQREFNIEWLRREMKDLRDAMDRLDGFLAEEFEVQEAFDSDLKQPTKCEGCETNFADPPSKLCPGCQAYRAHQS